MRRLRGWSAGVVVTTMIAAGCVPGPGSPSLSTPFDTTKLTVPAVVVYQRITHTFGLNGQYTSYVARTGVGTSVATAAERGQAQGFDSSLGYRVVDNLTANTISTTTAGGTVLGTLVDPMFPIPSSTPTGYWIYGLRWSPDGAKLAITRLFEILAGGFAANTTVYDALTGARLGSTFAGRDFTWKYDSAAVALPSGADVRTMVLTAGAAAVTVSTVAPGECASPMDWSVGERLVFLCPAGPDSPVRTLTTMPATGGPRRLLESGTTGSTSGWLIDAPTTARFVPGSNQIIFNRPSSVDSTISLQPVTGRALYVVDDVPGASPTPVTVVSPTLDQGQGFTTEDLVLGFL